MTAISAQLSRLAVRLRGAVTAGGGAVNRRMAAVSGDLRKIADNWIVVDSRAAAALGRVAPDAPLLSGVSPVTGMRHAFYPSQVRSVPILGRDAKVVGVWFPLKLRDPKQPLTLTPYALSTIGANYRQSVRTGGSSRKPEWAHEGLVSAPWAGRDLVFARAHANQHGYYIQIAKRIPFTKWSRWVPVRVDGENYGRLLAADRHFQQAVRGASTADLIQMSCDAAKGEAARESATALQSTGIGFDVHATEKTHFYHYLDVESGPGWVRQEGISVDAQGSEVELDEKGDPAESPWKRYRALRESPPAGG